jgi:hypothetical protein
MVRVACKMVLQMRVMKMESILRHCAHQHALESILGVSMNERRSKSTVLASMSFSPPSGITKDITMIVLAWSLSLHNSLQCQVFHLIVVNPCAQYILMIKLLKVGWKVNPSLCWALIYWSTGTQHIPYSIFNHARIFMGQWIRSATVRFPVLSLHKVLRMNQEGLVISQDGWI